MSAQITSKKILNDRLREEIDIMQSYTEVMEFYNKHKTSRKIYECIPIGDTSKSYMYPVFFRKENIVILYDETEDEFAIGQLNNDATVFFDGTYDSLYRCLFHVIKENK